ncbi:MAG TPA: aspartyl/asparaginyl beta-hydroxylase domain-containing protein [Polyangiaceae bacterium]|jgi:aspartate beta-hydroxylase
MSVNANTEKAGAQAGDDLSGRVADRMWHELRARFPEAELGRMRGLLDVLGERRTPVLEPMQGVKHGLFMPDLPSSPWMERGVFAELAGDLERLFPELRAEVLRESAREAFRPYGNLAGEAPVVREAEGWDELRLWEDLHPTEVALRFPVAVRALSAIVARCSLVNSVMLLSMKPGTRLAPHHDRANWYVSVHMGLVVPPKCAIRVGGEARTWEEGRCMVFDNSYEHEAWNDGDATRIILAVHLAHPDLTATEREAIRLLHHRYQSLMAVGPEAMAAWASVKE